MISDTDNFSVKTGTKIVKAPYFLPFGNPIERASIPKEYEKYFSNSCINRSILLWQEIERGRQLGDERKLCGHRRNRFGMVWFIRGENIWKELFEGDNP